MQMSMLDNIIEIQVCEKIGVSDVFGKCFVYRSTNPPIQLPDRINAYNVPVNIFIGLRQLARGPTNENQLSLFSKPLIS